MNCQKCKNELNCGCDDFRAKEEPSPKFKVGDKVRCKLNNRIGVVKKINWQDFSNHSENIYYMMVNDFEHGEVSEKSLELYTEPEETFEEKLKEKITLWATVTVPELKDRISIFYISIFNAIPKDKLSIDFGVNPYQQGYNQCIKDFKANLLK